MVNWIRRKSKEGNRLLQSRLLLLVLISGTAGFFIGAGLYPDWQVSVEAGQIIAGVVHYPSQTVPQYAYVIKTWTVLNQLSAFLLWAGLSEAAVAMIISGVLGALAFQAVAVLFYSIGGGFLLSLLIPFFISFMSYVGWGVVYPIAFIDTPHSYGRFGLAYVLLIIGIFNAGRFKTGSFLLGAAPCIHPTWGSYAVLLVGAVLLLFYRERAAKQWRTLAAFFAGGLLITVASYAYQNTLIAHFPPLSGHEKTAYIASFIKYWDYHRIPFNYLSPGFLIGLAGAVVCFLFIRFHGEGSDRPLFVFRALIVSFFLSTVLSLVTYLPVNVLPMLHIAMPGRYINLNNIVFVPLLLGILAARNGSGAARTAFSIFVLCSLALKISLPNTEVMLPRLPFHFYYNTPKDVNLIVKAVFTILLPLPVIMSLLRPALFERNAGRTAAILFRGSAAVLLVLSAAMLYRGVTFSGAGALKIADPVLKAASARSGMILLSKEEFFPVQIPLRRATPIDPGALDGFLVVPESGPRLNNILQKIYGMDLFFPPLKEGGAERTGGTIPCVYKKLWEDRNPEQWMKIREEFGVTDVLVASGWRLNLPVVEKSEAYALYAVSDDAFREAPLFDDDRK